MSKTLEKGQEKIQKICENLRYETLEPAKAEAARIIEEAKAKAALIVEEGHKQAERLHSSARMEIEKERNVFHSSLLQAAKQSLESLRQQIEKELFNDELLHLIRPELVKPHTIADLIKAIIAAIDKKGIETNLEIVIPQAVSAKDVNILLGDNILKRVKNKSVGIGHFGGGVQVKLLGEKLTLDITDEDLKELMGRYVRKDFREMLFSSK